MLARFALCALAALALVEAAHAGSGWSNTFPPGNGLNGTVRALLAFDDGSGPALFVGGDFTTAGGIPANHIAKWDGDHWSALGAEATSQISSEGDSDPAKDGQAREGSQPAPSSPAGMGWLEFAAELVHAVAWPIVALVLAVLLRGPIVGLVPLLRRLKYKDLELEFEKALEEVQSTNLPVKPDVIAFGLQDLGQDILRLAQISPRAAILESWMHVEAASREALAASHPQLGEPMTAQTIGRALQQAEILTGHNLETFHRMRSLRNLAAHTQDFSVSPETAADYARNAMRLAAFVRDQVR